MSRFFSRLITLTRLSYRPTIAFVARKNFSHPKASGKHREKGFSSFELALAQKHAGIRGFLNIRPRLPILPAELQIISRQRRA